MTRWSWVCLGLAGLCSCTAIAVVFTQHLSRGAWSGISASRQAIDELEVEWSRLQIEESTFSGHARVEEMARNRLDMTYPGLDGSRRIALGASVRDRGPTEGAR